MPQLVIKNQLEVTLWRCTFLQLQEWRSGLDVRVVVRKVDILVYRLAVSQNEMTILASLRVTKFTLCGVSQAIPHGHRAQVS